MRELKFRAWHKGSSEMLNEERIGDVFKWYQDHQNIDIMQYTGLKDKNGKEIYEGDICKTYQIGIGNLNQVVVFDDGSFTVHHPLALTTELRGFKIDYIEIIGNIYEHKNLINETSN